MFYSATSWDTSLKGLRIGHDDQGRNIAILIPKSLTLARNWSMAGGVPSRHSFFAERANLIRPLK